MDQIFETVVKLKYLEMMATDENYTKKLRED
jgi:hypothetical protein